jgi:hypothetical protein
MGPSLSGQSLSNQDCSRIKYYIFDFTVSVYHPPLSNDAFNYIDHFSQGGYVRDRNSSRRSWDPYEEFDPFKRDIETVGRMLKYEIYMVCYFLAYAAHKFSH